MKDAAEEKRLVPLESGRSGIFLTLALNSAVVAALFLSSFYSYLLFHSLIEFVTIVIAFALLVLTWNTRRYFTNNFLKILGMGYAFCAAIDLVHTLAYKGMNIFHDGPNLPTQLWIAARCLQAGCLVLALVFMNRKANDGGIIAAFATATGVLLAAVFHGYFPDCFIEGRGLTGFKIYAEYAISVVLIIALVCLCRSHKKFEHRVEWLVRASVVCTILSELSFTQYASVFGPANMLGHYFKLAAFYFVYRSIVVTGIQEPFALVFRDLAQRTVELEEANEELESFNSAVAHDLRAPLRRIRGFSVLLSEEAGSTLNDDARRYLANIQGGLDRMSSLVEDLLSLSRLGKQELHMQTYSLRTLVDEVMEELRPAMQGRNIEWHIGDLPFLECDPSLFRQVFINLVSNAVKFTRERNPAVIEIGQTVVTGDTVIFIRDNGAGFDMKYYDRLFGVFQRLHHQEEFEGTGIGLAIVQRIMHRHGGNIWAEAELNKGATFYLSLHSTKPEAALAAAAAGGAK